MVLTICRPFIAMDHDFCETDQFSIGNRSSAALPKRFLAQYRHADRMNSARQRDHCNASVGDLAAPATHPRFPLVCNDGMNHLHGGRVGFSPLAVAHYLLQMTAHVIRRKALELMRCGFATVSEVRCAIEEDIQ